MMSVRNSKKIDWLVLRCDDGVPFVGECTLLSKGKAGVVFEVRDNVAHDLLKADSVSVLHEGSFRPCVVTCKDSIFPLAICVSEF